MPKKQRSSDAARVIPFHDLDMAYDRDEFLAPDKDDRGLQVTVTFRVTPLMDRALEVMRDSHRFPYKTCSDIIRHAVVRHLAWLQALEPDLPRHILDGLHAVNEVCRDTEMRLRIEDSFANLDKLILLRLDQGDASEALRLMSVARSKITGMPESLWKTKWVDSFNRKYASYLTPAPPAPTPPAAPSNATAANASAAGVTTVTNAAGVTTVTTPEMLKAMIDGLFNTNSGTE